MTHGPRAGMCLYPDSTPLSPLLDMRALPYGGATGTLIDRGIAEIALGNQIHDEFRGIAEFAK